MKRKITIITGSRAEWGLLKNLARLIQNNVEMQLQIIATNMHLSPEFGLTYKEIEEDGFKIDRRVEMLISGDTANATTKSVGLATIGFADAYETLQPDLLIILGDRYEMLAAATAALFYKIPIAHLHGGEITEGAYDDSIRHAITKMSHLHFTSTEEYRHRVIQLGEQPDTVFNVGAIGIDNIKAITLLNKSEIERQLGGFKIDKDTISFTFHPVTMEDKSAKTQMNEILAAFDAIPQLKIIFSMPNSDTDGRILISMIKSWCNKNGQRAIWVSSLGSQCYFSLLQYIGAVVGNSSSGIIEVPSFKIHSINIGDRQKGRIKAKSVIDVAPQKEAIKSAILEYIGKKVITNNPYEKEDTAQNIIKIINRTVFQIPIQKHFYDLPYDQFR